MSTNLVPLSSYQEVKCGRSLVAKSHRAKAPADFPGNGSRTSIPASVTWQLRATFLVKRVFVIIIQPTEKECLSYLFLERDECMAGKC